MESSIIEQSVKDETATQDFSIANSGNSALTVNINMNYVLPGAPTSNYSAKIAPKGEFKGKFKMSDKRMAKRMAPANDSEAQYVLKYSGDNYSKIGLGNASSAIFANMYPGDMLSNIVGMSVSSVDVYVGDAPKSASIVIYGEKSQTKNGELVAEKSFAPVADSWNHVVLDQPIAIDGKDLWVGVKMNELKESDYCIGVDQGPAIVGFGDIVNIGGDTWWSMADLGLDYNYCIRANVTGTRTAAINWLSVDKNNVEVAAGNTEKVNVNFAPQGLAEGIYEAYLDITINDPLNAYTRIPVYMTKGQSSGISLVKDGMSDIVLRGNVLSVSGKGRLKFASSKRQFLDEVRVQKQETNAIGNIISNTNSLPDTKVYSIDGRYLGNDINALGHGMYVVGGKKVVK